MARPDLDHHDPGGEGLRDQPVTALLKQLSEQTATLFRQEVDLAKAELGSQAKQVGAGAGLIGGGALTAVGAFGALIAAVIAALATGMPTWLAALIVAVVLALVATALALAGKRRVTAATPPAPKTKQTIQEDVTWAKTRTPSGSR